MEKLLTEQELEDKLDAIICKNLQMNGFDMQYIAQTMDTIKNIASLIQSQKIAHANIVIGSNYTRDQFDAVSVTFKINPHLGLTKLSTMASEDDLRDTQRQRNK